MPAVTFPGSRKWSGASASPRGTSARDARWGGGESRPYLLVSLLSNVFLVYCLTSYYPCTRFLVPQFEDQSEYRSFFSPFIPILQSIPDDSWSSSVVHGIVRYTPYPGHNVRPPTGHGSDSEVYPYSLFRWPDASNVLPLAPDTHHGVSVDVRLSRLIADQ